MRISRWTSLALGALVAAVLVTPVRAQQVEIKPAVKVKRDRYILTAEEIAERPDITNAYDAVRLLRPNFLKPTRAKTGMTAGSSGGTGPDPYKPGGTDPGASSGAGSGYGGSSGGASTSLMPVLYLDDMKQEDVERMKSVRVVDVVEIRYVAGSEASGRYGTGHEGGVILLKTKRLGPG